MRRLTPSLSDGERESSSAIPISIVRVKMYEVFAVGAPSEHSVELDQR